MDRAWIAIELETTQVIPIFDSGGRRAPRLPRQAGRAMRATSAEGTPMDAHPSAICEKPASALELSAEGGPRWLCRDHLSDAGDVQDKLDVLPRKGKPTRQ